MICYKDMTFCNFLECKNIGCERRLTDKVYHDADVWWGKPNTPIMIFAQKPKCFEDKKE